MSLRGANQGSQGIEEVSWVFPEPEPDGANTFGSDVWVDVSVSMDDYAGYYKLSEGQRECRLDSPIDKLLKKLGKLRSSLSDFLSFAFMTRKGRTLAQG